eukprot:827108_1
MRTTEMWTFFPSGLCQRMARRVTNMSPVPNRMPETVSPFHDFSDFSECRICNKKSSKVFKLQLERQCTQQILPTMTLYRQPSQCQSNTLDHYSRYSCISIPNESTILQGDPSYFYEECLNKLIPAGLCSETVQFDCCLQCNTDPPQTLCQCNILNLLPMILHYCKVYSIYIFILLFLSLPSPSSAGNVLSYNNGQNYIFDGGYEALELVGLQINVLSGYLFGYGYSTIAGETSSITVTDSNGLWFWAAFAADSCSQIVWNDPLYKEMYCSGTNSCSNIAPIQTNNIHHVSCEGAVSCYASTITNIGDGYYVPCSGDQSCAYATITHFEDIEGFGPYSLMHATINSGGVGSVEITLSGYHAGFGATINCETNDICTINCYGNACSQTLILCDGDCTVNTFNILVQPIYNINDYNPSMLTLVYDSSDLSTTYEQRCNQNVNAIKYDDYQAHYNGANIMVSGVDHGPVCCRGSESCEGVNNISITTNSEEVLVCGGALNCSGVTSIQNPNGTVFCGGGAAGIWGSCDEIGSIQAKNLYCLGYYACGKSDIVATQNVYCGYHSCSQLTITSAGPLSVYLLGVLAGSQSTIYCNGPDHCFIQCGAVNACQSLTVHCGDCEIDCPSEYDCPVIVTVSPTDIPTTYPTLYPTSPPTEPTMYPTVNPTNYPTTVDPTVTPTHHPTRNPTLDPTNVPTIHPTFPTIIPTLDPTLSPTFNPTVPTNHPTLHPTNDPSTNPTITPTLHPTLFPTKNPTNTPTNPTFNPTMNPTTYPTKYPTMDPSRTPSASPSTPPTLSPSLNPTIAPTLPPTSAPTFSPTSNPTLNPSKAPTLSPSYTPSSAPTFSPSFAP